MKISQLRAFVAIATSGNFSAAALELDLSQSTISHAIAALEKDLGVVLLQRGRHGAVLTAVGEELLSDARQVLAILDDIRQKADQTKGLQAGQVRVSCVRSIAAQVLPDILACFRTLHPQIRVVITERDRYAQIEQALREGDIDVGFVVLPTGDEFDTWEVCRDEFVAVLPPNTEVAEKPLTWDALLAHPMIMNPAIAPYHIQLIRERLGQFGYTLTISDEVTEDTTILGLVQRGLGATIMPRMTAEPLPPGVQVKPLPVPLERTTGVAILANALLPRAVFAFLDAVRDYKTDCPL